MRVVERWPADKLRPTHCFKTILGGYVQREFQANQKAVVNKEALANRLKRAEVNLAALDRIVSNEAMKKYPLPSRLRHPVEKPKYYDELIKAIDDTANRKEQPKGLFKRLFGK
ncbi:hypothetical protein H4219_000829 [Mycoemilia scoparia]|uniref:Uncharacterized protein n=1 Tax=Mycoemilia scoparia TaxID=417184 RepID=A0A9W8AB62_9FUNG|nr:hypothetical protein H4219_000829 [Mycoemilia scoparia]